MRLFDIMSNISITLLTGWSISHCKHPIPDDEVTTPYQIVGLHPSIGDEEIQWARIANNKYTVFCKKGYYVPPFANGTNMKVSDIFSIYKNIENELHSFSIQLGNAIVQSHAPFYNYVGYNSREACLSQMYNDQISNHKMMNKIFSVDEVVYKRVARIGRRLFKSDYFLDSLFFLYSVVPSFQYSFKNDTEVKRWKRLNDLHLLTMAYVEVYGEGMEVYTQQTGKEELYIFVEHFLRLIDKMLFGQEKYTKTGGVRNKTIKICRKKVDMARKCIEEDGY